VTERIDLTLKLGRDEIELARDLVRVLVTIARALDTSAADQALIAAKLKPIVDRLERLNVPDKKE
jgi:hypothetical protein